jgi:phage gp29-like protein
MEQEAKNNMKKPDTKILTTQLITDNVLGSFLNYMPNPDSIVPGAFSSYETYREMRTDPRIKSLLNKLKTAALNFPIHITQPDGCPDDVFNFVNGFALWNKLYQKLKRIYSGLDYGFSVSELVWRFEDGRYIPDNIITRKPERFVFGRDWKLYQHEFGQRKPLDQPYKWLEYHHDTDDENPYGTSVLRCVYWAWMFKRAGYEFWLQATEKFSVKSVLAIFKADGDDNSIREKARSIAEQLLSLTSGSAAAVGNVDAIHEVGMSGDLIGFASLVDACDTQISYGLTGQSIATSKTEGGSLALGEVQADLFYEDAKGIALEGLGLIQKIINWSVALNGFTGAVPPVAEIDTERKASFSEVMSAIDHGVPVSRASLYSRYGLPEPRDDEDTFKKDSPSELTLSDSGKKKARNKKPLIRIM